MTALDPRLTAALERFTGADSVLAALDFDGCLAPIVEEPSEARALPGSASALAALAARDNVTVALVSGRSLEDLRAVADPPAEAVLVASHGAEVAGAPGPEVPRDVLDRVVSALEEVVLAHPGTALERKPAAAVLHTRRAERDVAERATSAAVAAAGEIEGAHVLQGKEVVEVSVVRADKGSALVALVERLDVEAVLYAGDDTTDEHAFAAVAGRRGPADVTIKVGDGDTAAAYRVADPEQVTEVLELLLRLTSR